MISSSELFSSITYPINLKFDEFNNLKTINGTGYLFCQFPFYDLNKDFINIEVEYKE